MNSNTAKDILDTLFESTKVNGFVETLHAVFGKNMKVSIPLTKTVCNTPLEMLELGTRADNALRRGRVFSIGELADLLASDDIAKARNIGKKTISEIKTKLLVYTYDQMNTADQKAFLWDLVQKNCDIHPIAIAA